MAPRASKEQNDDENTVQGKKLDTAEPSGEVQVEKYEERTYWDALTDEHRAALEEAGQLPPKPASDDE